MNSALQRAWRRALRRIGYAWLFALLLLAMSVAITLWTPRLNQRAEALRAAVVAQSDLVSRLGKPAPRPRSNGEQAAEVMRSFPPLAQSSADLAEVFAIAQQRKVTLLKGEYQLKAEPNTSLVSYSVTLPMRHEYGALKGFAADVLEALPHASMDELRMARPDAGSSLLDSVVRFTFTYRN